MYHKKRIKNNYWRCLRRCNYWYTQHVDAYLYASTPPSGFTFTFQRQKPEAPLCQVGPVHRGPPVRTEPAPLT